GRQVGLDALARREVQARIELADDDFDASRRRRSGLVESERTDLVEQAGGERGRRLFRIRRERRGEQAAGDDEAPRQAARRDAREGGEQGDRQHAGTLGAGASAKGANRPGKVALFTPMSPGPGSDNASTWQTALLE